MFTPGTRVTFAVTVGARLDVAHGVVVPALNIVAAQRTNWRTVQIDGGPVAEIPVGTLMPEPA